MIVSEQASIHRMWLIYLQGTINVFPLQLRHLLKRPALQAAKHPL